MCFSKQVVVLDKADIPVKSPIVLPAPRRVVTGIELFNAVKLEAPLGTVINIHNLLLADTRKMLCDIADIEAFLKVDKTNHIKFVDQDYDCDDFAFRLKGQFSVPVWSKYAIGLVWTDTHALLCFVDVNLDFWWIEPQSDSVTSKLEPWQGQNIRFIII